MVDDLIEMATEMLPEYQQERDAFQANVPAEPRQVGDMQYDGL